MHEIEPYYNWQDRYIASEDERSPFYGRVYDEFVFTQKIYNYFIHPQWDEFGSQTLYLKLLFADYELGFAIIEMLGEWNDCLQNDVMFLKREVVDELEKQGIHKFILICENVLNFHGSDDCYYEEWFEEVVEEKGWICFLNLLVHVEVEMKETHLHPFVNFGSFFNHFNWRSLPPTAIFRNIEAKVNGEEQSLRI